VSKKPRQAPAAPKVVRNEVAARYRTGQEAKVRRALAPFGTLDTYPAQRMVVLTRAPGITSTAAAAALDELRRLKLVEFVTPVLRDPDTNTRQVLTDEIVVRMKPGRTRRTLAALGAPHGIAIARQNEFEPSQYIVTVAEPSGTQTLDVARSLDSSDEVEFASPNFLTQVKR
jgi:hypothetical protein